MLEVGRKEMGREVGEGRLAQPLAHGLAVPQLVGNARRWLAAVGAEAVGMPDVREVGLAPRRSRGDMPQDVGLGGAELGEDPPYEPGVDAVRLLGVCPCLRGAADSIAMAPLRGGVPQVVPRRIKEVDRRLAMAAQPQVG